MVRTVNINMTPNEITTDGFLKVREADQLTTLRFLPDADFRGTLKSVEWNIQDNVKHIVQKTDAAFGYFKQIGERPEIEVSGNWLKELDLPDTALLRIKFEFDTFRMEPVWYAFLYLKTAYGDLESDSEAAYKVSL